MLPIIPTTTSPAVALTYATEAIRRLMPLGTYVHIAIECETGGLYKTHVEYSALVRPVGGNTKVFRGDSLASLVDQAVAVSPHAVDRTAAILQSLMGAARNN